MDQLLSIEAATSLVALTFMEILLGIDNVIFVSIILGRIKSEADKKKASLIWMVVGIIFRIVLLFFLAKLIDNTGKLFTIFEHPVSLKDIITLGGGLFLMINTTLEIHNKLEGDDPDTVAKNKKGNSFKSIVGQIILIDIIFSFDGIITAIGMVKNQFFIIRIIAVLISMAFMFIFAPRISSFIHKHPTFKMLALSFLILIGVLLVIEGIHIEQISIPHGYIYFAMAFSFGVEVLNLRMRKKQGKTVALHEAYYKEKPDNTDDMAN
ncbi:MAG: TerC family protein [Chitinophagaceae bacterium]|nr:TerC family protein [Chitinophagaceae bacterium]